MKKQFLDGASGIQMSQAALDEYCYWSHKMFVNPSSYKNYSHEIDYHLQRATDGFLDFIDNEYNFVEYTSGASESIISNIIHRFIKGEFTQLISPKYEHPNAESCMEVISGYGCEIIRIETDNFGRINSSDLEIDLNKPTLIYSSYINGLTGEFQDLQWLTELKDDFLDAKLIIDVTQVFGKLKGINCFSADEIFCSAHKFGGPKGFGLRFSREPFSILGPNQSRPGTLNVPAIMASRVALDEAFSRNWETELIEKVQEMNLPLELIQSHNSSGLIKMYGCHEFSSSELVAKFPDTILGFGTACSSGVFNVPIIYQKIAEVYQLKSVVRIS